MFQEDFYKKDLFDIIFSITAEKVVWRNYVVQQDNGMTHQLCDIT